MTNEKIKKYQETKDINLRNEVAVEHMYIAEIVAKKYKNKGIEYEDLYQECCMELITIVDRFDITKNVKFKTFAGRSLEYFIKRYFRDNGWDMKPPRRIQELSLKIKKAREELAQLLEEEVTIEDIAEYLNETEEAVIEATTVFNNSYRIHSIESIEQMITKENHNE